jgi:hypothetical protein
MRMADTKVTSTRQSFQILGKVIKDVSKSNVCCCFNIRCISLFVCSREETSLVDIFFIFICLSNSFWLHFWDLSDLSLLLGEQFVIGWPRGPPGDYWELVDIWAIWGRSSWLAHGFISVRPLFWASHLNFIIWSAGMWACSPYLSAPFIDSEGETALSMP